MFFNSLNIFFSINIFLKKKIDLNKNIKILVVKLKASECNITNFNFRFIFIPTPM